MAFNKQKILSGGRWVAFTTLVTSVIGAITTIALPRYIRPEDFGVYALATLVVTLAQKSVSFGQGEYIVYKGRDGGKAEDVVFSSYFLISILFFLLQLVFAGQIAGYFNNARLVPLLRWMSAGYFIYAFSIVPGTILSREMEFKKKFWPELAGVVIYTLVGLTLAIRGAGVWALVAATLGSNGAIMVCSWMLSKWRPVFKLEKIELAGLLKYGTPLFLSGIVIYIFQNMDNFFIGKFMDAKQLGYYAIAFQFALLIPSKASAILGNVTFPALCSARDNMEQVRTLYLNSLNLASFAAGLIMLSVVIMARPFIHFVYGSTWEPSIVPMQLLSAFGFILVLTSTTGQVLLTYGKTKVLFYLNLLNITVVLLGMRWALGMGITGVAVLMAATAWLGCLLAIAIVVRFLKINILGIFRQLFIMPSVAAIMVLFYMFFTGKWSNQNNIVNSTIWLVVIISVYTACSFGFNRDLRHAAKLITGHSKQ